MDKQKAREIYLAKKKAHQNKGRTDKAYHRQTIRELEKEIPWLAAATLVQEIAMEKDEKIN